MLMEGLEGKAKQLYKPLVVARNIKAGRRPGRRRNPWQEPLISIPPKGEGPRVAWAAPARGTWGQDRWLMPQWVYGAGTRTQIHSSIALRQAAHKANSTFFFLLLQVFSLWLLPPWEGTVSCNTSALSSTMSPCQEASLTPVPKNGGTTNKNCSVATSFCCHKPSQLKISCWDRLAAQTSVRLLFTKCHEEDTHQEH